MTSEFNQAAIALSKTLPFERRLDFLSFVHKGEASPDFIAWLEADKTALAAVETMFVRTAIALEGIAGIVKAGSAAPKPAPRSPGPR